MNTIDNCLRHLNSILSEPSKDKQRKQKNLNSENSNHLVPWQGILIEFDQTLQHTKSSLESSKSIYRELLEHFLVLNNVTYCNDTLKTRKSALQTALHEATSKPRILKSSTASDKTEPLARILLCEFVKKRAGKQPHSLAQLF